MVFLRVSLSLTHSLSLFSLSVKVIDFGSSCRANQRVWREREMSAQAFLFLLNTIFFSLSVSRSSDVQIHSIAILSVRACTRVARARLTRRANRIDSAPEVVLELVGGRFFFFVLSVRRITIGQSVIFASD